MATSRGKTKAAVEATPTCELELKRAGKTAAHFWDNEEGGFCKDMYVPIEEFKALGSPDKIRIVVEAIT